MKVKLQYIMLYALSYRLLMREQLTERQRLKSSYIICLQKCSKL